MHKLFFFFLTSLLEYNCFKMLSQFLLYKKVNQLFVQIYPHIPSLLHLPPTLLIPPLQVVTKHPADLPVLCGCFCQLSTLHLVVYICPCHSLTSSQLTLPPPHGPQVHLLRLHLYSCLAPRFFRTCFFVCLFQIPYICVSIYGICFSLSDLLHYV